MTVLDSFKLTGRVAIVTGGNRGLGRAFATALADAGASVAVVGRDADRNERAVAALRESGATAIAVAADVTRPADVSRMTAEVLAAFGKIDILVNNAGLAIHRPALDVPDEEWRQVFDVNVTGVWQCSREVGRHMVTRRSGVIVNVGSISALIVNRPQWQPAYNASKAAVHQLTRSLAAEWAPYNVRVNALAPGYVKTDMAPVDRPEFRQHWILDPPMQRYAEPAEIAPSLLYLASDASSFVTGSVLVVDGGYTVW